MQLVLGSNDANGTNFPDGFKVNQWKDFKVSSATGSASIASISVTQLTLRNCNKFGETLSNFGEILSYVERFSP